jgi:hypothetical protein
MRPAFDARRILGAVILLLLIAVVASKCAGIGGQSGGKTQGNAAIAALWEREGGSAATAANAACHAMQESSGRSWVTSSNPDGGTNVGYWQLDTKGKGAGYSVAQLQDPATNARVAVQATDDGTDWSAWQTPGC